MNEKKKLILKAAVEVVSRYGFRRSSMDDVAQAAGISRPALYQHFRNKDELFTNCLDLVFEDGNAEAEAAVQTVAGRSDKTAAFLAAYVCFNYRIVIAGPHGAELLDVTSRLGPDKITAARARLIKRLNQLAQMPENDDTGRILAHASEGLKTHAPDEKTLAAQISILVHKFLGGA